MIPTIYMHRQIEERENGYGKEFSDESGGFASHHRASNRSFRLHRRKDLLEAR